MKSPAGALLLMVLAAFLGSCGRPAERLSVMKAGTIVKMTDEEIRAGLVAGELGETTPLFVSGRWTVLCDEPRGARWVEEARREIETKRDREAASMRVRVVNESNPGEPIRLEDHLVPGKIVIFDFYSDGCPPCRAIAPRLERLAGMRPDLVVRKIDINRPGYPGIDWKSPLVEQHGLRSIPHFVIFGAEGRKMADDAEAKSLVWEWIERAGV